MSDRPDGFIQKPSEMIETARERYMNSHIYSRTADGSLVVEAIVSQLAADLAEIPQKANLRDTEQIKRICIAYVASCAKAGVIPTKIGLARALGMSRRAVDYFMERHPEHETAQVLELVFDAFAEALSTAALAGSVQQVFAIFVSKCIYKWEDSVTIKTTPPDPLDNKKSVSEIMARYDAESLKMLPAD